MDSGLGLLQNGSSAQLGESWTFQSAIYIMPPIRVLLKAVLSAFAFADAALGLLSPVHRFSGNGSASAVCNNPQLSCHNTTVVDNLCCFNAPGGALLQTQFWDTNPASGPDDSWTIHGLWVRTVVSVSCKLPTNMSNSLTTAMAPISNIVTTKEPTRTSQLS